MLKIVGLIGSNADCSYNRLLLKYIKKKIWGTF